MNTLKTAQPDISQYTTDRTRRVKQRKLLSLIFSWIGILLIVLYCLAPFYWMLVSSLRKPTQIFETSLWPRELTIENYQAVFDPSRGFMQALINSTIVSAVTTVIALVIATFAAYALARLEFRGKSVILILVVATSMFPLVAIVVPLLKLFTDWEWINTYQAMIVPNLSFALPLAVWNLTSFFRMMPAELEQAAMVDGCTPAQAFRRVILPLAAPGMFTTAILIFISAWNEFLIAVTMINDPNIQTAPVAISKFGGVSQFETPYGSQMAAGVVVTIPLVLLVLFFQRRIVAGLAAGSLK
ncbi:carbohydrate ABC transporter permease [Mobiluncus mulieris]|uniref:carbohydrate ABC transporter permease n=1 Tax=Mobiluncus mulieris TaxID=2052 RepID=UPI00019F8F23|nr:carbohydrate ABC transporter permease [Mobiluncus mulieris]EEJ52971.1 ABC transporter, permease protein [Mobiluncus mulieris ATCC 35243]MCU9971798.1 carbohydrate ABC transporter permease [Mobiluncus mulieris]MCU9975048.1 carbohydrate ABC transporter permease [Mobiluncus mulieris]MCV0002012.1 carbohydrate ABC transporter permease [Mobiluncus mulieris]NMW91575.1 carbohydrate ABC transporter permease [Mobiluncus mulieris]